MYSEALGFIILHDDLRNVEEEKNLAVRSKEFEKAASLRDKESLMKKSIPPIEDVKSIREKVLNAIKIFETTSTLPRYRSL